MTTSEAASGGNERTKDCGLDQVAVALKGLRFGQATVTVQDGVIIQIDRTERRRLSRTAG